MFYFASKVFWMLAQPLSICLLLIAGGWLLTWFRHRRSGLVLGGIGIGLLALGSFTTLGEVLIQPLETRFVRPSEMPTDVATIVMLGGATAGAISLERGVTELKQAGDRLVETLFLAQRYPEAKILLSGGTGELTGGGEPEAFSAQRFFVRLGIAAERIVIEENSRNTDENAQFSREYLESNPGTVVLVTSAFHMPRSVGLFRKQGVEVIAWPTDYRSTGTRGVAVNAIEPVTNLDVVTTAAREWIGLVVYRLTGRIDSVLPAQASN